MLRRSLLAVFAILALTGSTLGLAGQLPPDAVKLDKVKIPETLKSADLCPVYLEPSDPSLPTWTYEGVTYRGAKPDAQEKFMADPAKYVGAVEKGRYIKNFMSSMSTIWCPVTDEITPGGMTEWHELGLTWESCCAFCDEGYVDEDFEDALVRLEARAEESFKLVGAKYVTDEFANAEGFSVVMGAILDPSFAAAVTTDAAEADVPEEPEWLRGRELEATYNGGVGAIFEHRCITCHRPGEIAPMSFLTYGEIRKWTKSMRTAITSKTMPPWMADESVGVFANSTRLTQGEIDVLTEWIDAGFPRGEGELETEVEWTEGWSIGEPDAVFELEEYTVGENVTGEVKEFVVKTDFPEDRWIVAAEGRPGNEYLVVGIEGGPLGSFHSGNTYENHQPGTGALLKAGAEIKVRVHYMKEAGYEDVDAGSRLGVVFAKDSGASLDQVATDRMPAPDFTIPAGEKNVEVTARFEFPADGQILSLMPIMHYRGKDVRYKAIFPGGEEKELLLITHWDPVWKTRYQLKAPMAAPKGTVVEAVAHFDNSVTNIKNPDPSAEVKSGPAGELFEGWIGYTLDGAK